MSSTAKKKVSKRLIKKLYTQPELVIGQVNLVYTTEDQLSISRIKKQKKFLYQIKDEVITQQSEIDRINKLVIPPAWEKVRINNLENGHLQAVGRDEKSRKQYRYHPIWNKIRNQTKFYRMSQFGEVLPSLRERVDKDLRQKKWDKTKVMALVVKLLEETHIRIGNLQYAKRNKTYGLSTLRKKHINLNGNKLKFEFIGKKGKEHKITLRNKKLVKLIDQCREIPGWELFKFYDQDGETQTVDSTMINEYIHDLTGASFTAKDFRTWSATIIFFESIKELGPAIDENEAKKNVLAAYDETAAALGNTRNVTRNYYVHPAVVDAYYTKNLNKIFSRFENSAEQSSNFSTSEKAVLSIIKNFNPFELVDN